MNAWRRWMQIICGGRLLALAVAARWMFHVKTAETDDLGEDDLGEDMCITLAK